MERVSMALIASEEALLSGDTSTDNLIAAQMLARAALTAAKQIADEGGNEAASVFLGAVLSDD